jgi:hypothetical protein
MPYCFDLGRSTSEEKHPLLHPILWDCQYMCLCPHPQTTKSKGGHLEGNGSHPLPGLQVRTNQRTKTSQCPFLLGTRRHRKAQYLQSQSPKPGSAAICPVTPQALRKSQSFFLFLSLSLFLVVLVLELRALSLMDEHSSAT